MPFKGLLKFPGVSIPQPNGIVRTSAGKRLPIRGERNRPNRACMPFKGVLVFAGVSVPQPNSIVQTSTGKCLPIEGECNRPNPIRMSRQ